MDRTFFKQFGGKVTKELIEEYQKSDNWYKGCFQNLEETNVDMSARKLPSILYKQLFTKKNRAPDSAIPVISFDERLFLEPSDKAKMIWYGHSVLLLRMKEVNILIDPMLGEDTTPIAPVSNKRFSTGTLSLIDDFPPIDLMVITHDHYDHLDYASIQKLKNITSRFFVAMGVKRHLVAWGVEPSIITEFDWWEDEEFAGIKITFTPTRHFSGRGLTDRMKTLWGGWLFHTSEEKIWFSGDGGYGDHFKEIGKRLGPFDFAFMECGQYNDDWKPIHLFPEESIQAAMDVGVAKVMPVHWGGFDLSYQHTWKEPVEEFIHNAQKQNVDFSLPRIGEIFTVNSILQDHWWIDEKGSNGKGKK